jgi:hypothetical protein
MKASSFSVMAYETATFCKTVLLNLTQRWEPNLRTRGAEHGLEHRILDAIRVVMRATARFDILKAKTNRHNTNRSSDLDRMLDQATLLEVDKDPATPWPELQRLRLACFHRLRWIQGFVVLLLGDLPSRYLTSSREDAWTMQLNFFKAALPPAPPSSQEWEEKWFDARSQYIDAQAADWGKSFVAIIDRCRKYYESTDLQPGQPSINSQAVEKAKSAYKEAKSRLGGPGSHPFALRLLISTGSHQFPAVPLSSEFCCDIWLDSNPNEVQTLRYISGTNSYSVDSVLL